MRTAREEILGRIAEANATAASAAAASAPAGASPDASRPSSPASPIPDPIPELTGEDMRALFVERARDYGATVRQVAEPEVAQAIEAIAHERGARRIAAAPGIPRNWKPSDLEILDGSELDAQALDQLDGVVTSSSYALAETGAVMLDHGPDQGQRALTLIPDLHICIVRADRILPGLAAALDALHPTIVAGRPVTIIAGPSATSDIELDRVEGVHGPRQLELVIVG